jgi:hypothetical protein
MITARERHENKRKVARRAADRVRILEVLRRGGTLYRRHSVSGRTIWQLSTGQFVQADAVADALRDEHVRGAGDSLFGSWPERSQTFWYRADDSER